MRKTINEPSTVKSETRVKDGAIYKYSLLVTESSDFASYKQRVYSFAIEMTDAEGHKTDAVSGGLFADVGKALLFFRKLISGLATPMNLAYIIEDEMG